MAKFLGLEFGKFAVNKSCNWDVFALVIIYRALPVISRCFPTLQETYRRTDAHRERVEGKYRKIFVQLVNCEVRQKVFVILSVFIPVKYSLYRIKFRK